MINCTLHDAMHEKTGFTGKQTIQPPKVPLKSNFVVILYCMDLDINANRSS